MGGGQASVEIYLFFGMETIRLAFFISKNIPESERAVLFEITNRNYNKFISHRRARSEKMKPGCQSLAPMAEQEAGSSVPNKKLAVRWLEHLLNPLQCNKNPLQQKINIRGKALEL